MTIAKKYRNIDEYALVGIALAKAGHRNMWDAGDWWNAGGKQFGVAARNRLVTQQGWKGYSRDTLKTYGSIAKRFPKPLSTSTLTVHIFRPSHRFLMRSPCRCWRGRSMAGGPSIG